MKKKLTAMVLAAVAASAALPALAATWTDPSTGIVWTYNVISGEAEIHVGWNDRWLVVIPASAIDADREKAMKLIESGVKDIRLGVKAYSRQGN